MFLDQVLSPKRSNGQVVNGTVMRPLPRRARELGDDAVAGTAEDAPSMGDDQVVHDLAMRNESSKRPFLVDSYHPTVADHVGSKDRCKLAFPLPGCPGNYAATMAKSRPETMLWAALGHVWMAPGWQGIFSHGGSVVLRSCVRPVGAAEAAGPDGNRGSRPDQTHGVALPLDPKQVALDPSVDRRCHHASSPSQASRACRRRPFRPPPKWPGSPPGASSGPSRCAPSCWPRRRLPPCAPCWQAA